MLTKTSDGVANGPRLKKALAGVIGGSMDRRAFLKRSGVTAGGVALASVLPTGMAKEAKAQSAPTKDKKKDKKKKKKKKRKKKRKRAKEADVEQQEDSDVSLWVSIGAGVAVVGAVLAWWRSRG